MGCCLEMGLRNNRIKKEARLLVNSFHGLTRDAQRAALANMEMLRANYPAPYVMAEVDQPQVSDLPRRTVIQPPGMPTGSARRSQTEKQTSLWPLNAAKIDGTVTITAQRGMGKSGALLDLITSGVFLHLSDKHFSSL